MNKNSFGLTTKQMEVWSYMARGYSSKGIAKKLNIRESTVKTHLNNIYLALGLNNASEDVQQYMTAALMYLKMEKER